MQFRLRTKNYKGKLAPCGQTNKSPFLNDPPSSMVCSAKAQSSQKNLANHWYSPHETNIREKMEVCPLTMLEN